MFSFDKAIVGVLTRLPRSVRFSSTVSEQAATVEIDSNNFAIVTLNRPKAHNVFSDSVIAELNTKFSALREQDGFAILKKETYV